MKQLQRIHAIDGIRGFSLLGILIANILIFQYGMWGKDEIHYFNISQVDEWVYGFIKIMIEGSFLPIFTFLFGYSLIMMRNSLEHKKLRIKWHLFRRSLMLIIFGLLHATYLWDGDILLLYGGMGIALLLFVNRKEKTILIWSITLFLLITIMSLFDFTESTDDPLENINYEPYIETATEIYSAGTYSEIKEYRNNGEDPLIDEIGDKKLAIVFFLLPFMMAPMFLLGMYAGKRQWFLELKQERKMYWKGMIIFLPAGLALKIYGYFQHVGGAITIGGPILALGYIFAFGVYYSKSNRSHLLQSFENIGKLSLSNYIMQTVICTTIFYGYGLGLFGNFGVLWGLLLGIVIFIGQMVISSFYLKYFRYGPFEKVLRMWTYLSISNKNN